MFGVVAYVVVSLLLVSGFGGVCGTAEGFMDVIIPNANIYVSKHFVFCLNRGIYI